MVSIITLISLECCQNRNYSYHFLYSSNRSNLFSFHPLCIYHRTYLQCFAQFHFSHKFKLQSLVQVPIYLLLDYGKSTVTVYFQLICYEVAQHDTLSNYKSLALVHLYGLLVFLKLDVPFKGGILNRVTLTLNAVLHPQQTQKFIRLVFRLLTRVY